MNNQLVGRILMLVLNLILIASIVFILLVDETYVGLIIILPCTIVSIIVQVDELIHPEKYEW